MRAAAERRDFPAAYAAWREYVGRRENPVLLPHPDWGAPVPAPEFGFSARELFEPPMDERILKSILGAAWWLAECQQSQGFQVGTLQCDGAGTLAQIALLFPEFGEAQRWLDLGLGVLAEHARRGLYPDGCPHERSIGYANLAYRRSRAVLILLEETAGKPQSSHITRPDKDVAAIRSGTIRLLDFINAMTLPNGQYPAFNDGNRGDGGLLVLADGALRFNQGEYLWPLAQLGRPLPEGAPVPLPLPYTSVNLPDARFAAMRSDWTPRAHCMIVNYGPFRRRPV